MTKQWRLLIELLWPDPPTPSSITSKPDVFRGTQFLLSYKNAEVKAAIRNNKFHHHKQSALLLAEELDKQFRQIQPDHIIPIPSSKRRLQERGYQHLLQILQHSTFRDKVCVTALKKHKHTKPQSHVDRKQRMTQQAQTYRCNTEITQSFAGTVVLLDDVVTTGATMDAAKGTLRPFLTADAKLVCLALAH